MASSSSASSVISIDSEKTREMTPEFDPTAAYEACAPLHCDAEEWDFQTWSEDDEFLTDSEDLQLLLGGELNEDDDDDMSWEGDFSSSEEEIDGTSIKEDSTAGCFLRGGLSEDDEETKGGNGGGDDGSSDDDNNDDDNDIGVAPPVKCYKVLGTY
jgi:hypothetical protein